MISVQRSQLDIIAFKVSGAILASTTILTSTYLFIETVKYENKSHWIGTIILVWN